MFTSKKVRNISIEEMNQIIKHADAYSNIIIGFSYDKRKLSLEHRNHSLTTHSYLKEHVTKIEFTTKYGTDEFKPCTYICRLDGEIDSDMRGLEAYRILRKYYKEDKVKDIKELEDKMPKTEKGSYLYSAGPAVDFNPKYDNTRHEVYIYDINSAYATQMMTYIPDIKTVKFYKKVEKGEVGFLLQSGLPLVPEGYQGDVVFKLIDSPYKKFAEEYYRRKKESGIKYKQSITEEDKKKWKEEKDKAKNILTYSVGYLQRTNPFIRAYIVNKCNELINKLIDDNTCMWNTDAIYSIVPRSDLKVGDEIGEWKEEYYKEFAQKGNNYQKDWEEPHNRGVCRKWFGKNYDLLIDSLPTKEQNKYILVNKKIVRRIKNEI